MTGLHSFPTLPIVALPQLPRTAAEAREMAKRMNAEAKRERARKDAEQAKRSREIEESGRRTDDLLRRMEKAGLGPRRGVKIDRAGIYAERNRPHPDDEARPASPGSPRRPRSFSEIAHSIYGPPDAGGSLIATAPRGGAQ